MKPDDKSLEDMLDDIREKAVNARDAANDFSIAVYGMRCRYSYHDAYQEMLWWQRVANDSMFNFDKIAARAEELADAGGDKSACVEKLYDAVAVLMRMIAVVEGKQKLGGEE